MKERYVLYASHHSRMVMCKQLAPSHVVEELMRLVERVRDAGGGSGAEVDSQRRIQSLAYVRRAAGAIALWRVRTHRIAPAD
jgi:hypothetical protein